MSRAEMTTVCIGGPLDGERMQSKKNQLMVPVVHEHSIEAWVRENVLDGQWEGVQYRREFFKDGPSVFVRSGLTAGQMISMLVDGYAERKKLQEKLETVSAERDRVQAGFRDILQAVITCKERNSQQWMGELRRILNESTESGLSVERDRDGFKVVLKR